MTKIQLKNVVWKEGRDYVVWNLNTGVYSFGGILIQLLDHL